MLIYNPTCEEKTQGGFYAQWLRSASTSWLLEVGGKQVNVPVFNQGFLTVKKTKKSLKKLRGFILKTSDKKAYTNFKEKK